ncbi:MAG: cell division protein ZapE [Methyloligellaceae bacterium]
MKHGPLLKYQAMVSAGEITPDPAQVMVMEQLQIVAEELEQFKPKKEFLSLFSGNSSIAPNGLYVYGGVGRGKTMLMDLFIDNINFPLKRRVHFHEFMFEVHNAIGDARKKINGDPIPYVAKNIASKAQLLCFDEFHVTDIADAMILGRLFSCLFEKNVVVVATSNVHPEGLYKDGLNRNSFLPFISMIQDKMKVHELSSERDYRLEKFQGEELYFIPNDDRAEKAIRHMFLKLTGHEEGKPCQLEVKGRKIYVEEASMGVARFTFEQLCAMPLGAADYLSIAHSFHTVLIEGVPVMGPHNRNEARRFNTLIDVLYDNTTGLVMSAEAEPDNLYKDGDGSFLFERTASRLNEMRSYEYLASKEQ